MPKFRRVFKVVGFLGLFTLPLHAVAAPADYQVWIGIISQFSLTESDPESPAPLGWFDFHTRRSEEGTMNIVRPGFGLKLNSKIKAFGGYAWISSTPDSSGITQHEHRLWQQIDNIIPLSEKFSTVYRIRQEQRYFIGQQGITHRFRFLARLLYQPKPNYPFMLTTWNEIFFNFDGRTPGFAHNRFFIGPAWRTDASLRLDIGYLNFQTKLTDGTFRSNSGIMALAVIKP